MRDYLSDEELEELILRVEEQELLKSPRYLKEEIVRKIGSLPEKKADKNKALLWYTLQVSFAAAAAVLFLFLMPAQGLEPRQLQPQERHMGSALESLDTLTGVLGEQSVRICGRIAELTDRLITTE